MLQIDGKYTHSTHIEQISFNARVSLLSLFYRHSNFGFDTNCDTYSLCFLLKHKMTRKRKVWEKFEDFLKKIIPEYIIKILVQSGYDNVFSVSALCEEDIKIIEEFVDANLKHVIVDSGVYKISEKFVFLPGHRKLILSLPTQLKLFENNKKRKVEQSERVIGTEQANVTTEQVVVREEVELLNQSEIDNLKEKLLSKLTKSAESIGLKEFTENQVISTFDVYINYSRSLNNKPSYKCSIKCIECEKIIPCTWNGYWQTGNLDKHLKNHLKKDESSEQQSLPGINNIETEIETETSTEEQTIVPQMNDSNGNINNYNCLNETCNNKNNQKDLDEVLGLNLKKKLVERELTHSSTNPNSK